MRRSAHWRSWLVIVQPQTFVSGRREFVFLDGRFGTAELGAPKYPQTYPRRRSKDTREVIRPISRNNPTWGAPRMRHACGGCVWPPHDEDYLCVRRLRFWLSYRPVSGPDTQQQ